MTPYRDGGRAGRTAVSLFYDVQLNEEFIGDKDRDAMLRVSEKVTG